MVDSANGYQEYSVIGRYATIRFSAALFFTVLSSRSEMQDDKHVLGVAAQTPQSAVCCATVWRHTGASLGRTARTDCNQRFGDFQRSRRPLCKSRSVT
jgi:hypothetical protein